MTDDDTTRLTLAALVLQVLAIATAWILERRKRTP